MATRGLWALLAEQKLSETGIILQSICADVGWALELVFVGTREAVQEAVGAHQPDLVLLGLELLQPDAAAYLHGLHLKNKQVPLTVFGEPAEKEWRKRASPAARATTCWKDLWTSERYFACYRQQWRPWRENGRGPESFREPEKHAGACCKRKHQKARLINRRRR